MSVTWTVLVVLATILLPIGAVALTMWQMGDPPEDGTAKPS